MKNKLLLFLFLCCAKITIAQLIPPSEFLPHELGEHFTPHHLLVDYFEHVAANSKQVLLQEYGRTNEDRPLIYTVVSSPENMANLENIRKNNLLKTGLLDGKATTGGPAIVWLSFGVHGNEAGASESSMAALYELVNPANKDIQSWLQDAVVILDPCINPDGFVRYTQWYRNASNLVPDPDPAAREHHEPWPGGRVNHYLFDLNRDWAWQTQVESQHRMVIYHQWMPHIHADFHEMGHNDPYYFAPAAQPFHQYITQWQSDFQHNIGKNHAKHFDQNNWAYFTREVFDLFYPSYGDTYPTFHGAIGMTYEQAGHSKAGRAILMENGDTLTLRDRIEHHKTTALSTVEVSARNAAKLNEAFESYFDKSNNDPRGKYKSFVLKQSNSKDKLRSICNLLDKNHIRYGKAGKNKVMKGFDYAEGKERPVSIDAGDLLISAHQPLGVLTQVLFEPEPFLPDSLTYDITAWALPYAYGVEAYAFNDKMVPSGEFIFEKKQLPAKKDPYAYLLPWASLEDVRFLGQLLNTGIKVRYATEPFETEGQKFPRGTMLIMKSDNRKFTGNLDKSLRALAAERNRDLFAATSGFVTKGHDFGSEKFRLIEKPHIGVLFSDKVSANSFGQVWQFFEQELGYPVTILEADALNTDRTLRKFNIIIMADGSYTMDTVATANLNDWTREGGRLIAIGHALKSFRGKKAFKIKPKTPEKKGKINKPKIRILLYGERERRSISNSNPGSIIRLELDHTHPLAFGLGNYYFSLKTGRNMYSYLDGDNSWNIGYTKKSPLVMGFIGSKLRKNLDENLVFGVQEQGRGSIVYMADNPLFRSFWYNGEMLLGNAVFLR